MRITLKFMKTLIKGIWTTVGEKPREKVATEPNERQKKYKYANISGYQI